MTAIRATVRQRRQAFAGGTELARRSLPEDPQQRAVMTAQRIAAITGCQHTEVVCWCCHAVVGIRDAWPAGGRDFECASQGDCTDRSGRSAETEEAERIIFGSVL